MLAEFLSSLAGGGGRSAPNGVQAKLSACNIGIFGACATSVGVDDGIDAESKEGAHGSSASERQATRDFFSDDIVPMMKERQISFADSQASTTAPSWSSSMTSTTSDGDADGEPASASKPIIIFDWDDTLCPTTHAEKNRQCAEAEAAELKAHAEAVEAVLRIASDLGHVCIVSMAGEGWIEETARKLMPSVGKTIKEMQIPVSLARVGVSQRCLDNACANGGRPSYILKRRAMDKVINKFGARPGQIISIGDSMAERWALQDLLVARSELESTAGWKDCRCKTVKFVNRPTLGELTSQLRTLAGWLPMILGFEGDLDLGEITEEDE